MAKKILSVLLLICSLILAACGQAPAPSAQAPAEQPAAEAPAQPAAEPVTIRVALVDYVQDITDKWLEETVVPEFQKANPNINVEFVYLSWGTLDETIQGYFASGSGADIINLGAEYIAEYGDRLAPLNSYLQEWPELEQYVPATLETVTWEGELRGIPWLTAPRAYLCRSDILSEAGVKTPATFEEAIAQAAATTKVNEGKLERAGFLANGTLDDWQEYINLIWSLGGELYAPNGAPMFDTAEARAALEFMYNRRRAILADETIAGLPEAQGSRLATGEVACQWSNLWGAPATDDALWEQIEISPGLSDPAFAESKPVVQVFTDWLAVPNYSKNIPAAVEFLKFLGSKENQNAYNEGFGSFPPRQDAWYGFVENPVMQKLGDLMNAYGRGFSDIRETAQFREILMAEMPLYLSDQQDIGTTLANIQEKYTQVLEDAGRIE